MTDFSSLGIRKDIVKGLAEMNIINPTAIQEEVIPVLLTKDIDLVAQAQTGTGKTAAYGLPLLERIDPKIGHIQALVLCPTRELGQQVAKQLFKFTKYTDKIFTEAVYGGEKIDIQITALKRTTHIVVATPGRLIDLLERKAINLDKVHTIVLDEADEMLSMGFKKELERVLEYLPGVKNKWLFSATIPNGIKEIVNKYLSPDAHRIELGSKETVNKGIDHCFVLSEDREKPNVLVQFLKSKKGERGVVFCNTKASAIALEEKLKGFNISCAAIQGDLLQKEREKVMRAFKNSKLQIMIATDIAARGIDVEALSFVVHYEFPQKEEYYTHRSGRTARAGRTGVSLALVNSKELKQVRYFENKLSISFDQIRR